VTAGRTVKTCPPFMIRRSFWEKVVMSSWNSDMLYEIDLFGCDGRHDEELRSSFLLMIRRDIQDHWWEGVQEAIGCVRICVRKRFQNLLKPHKIRNYVELKYSIIATTYLK